MLKPLLLSEVAAALGGRLVAADSLFNGVSIDSRGITKGQLFIALTGPRFDGHDYLNEVAAKGAVAALVEREVPESALPQLVVKNARVALGQLGALNRAGYHKPVAAITGSSGKTTVKEMLACILRTRGPVLATKGNLNNDLGVPLTLLELTQEHTAAVIELGASRLGEIAYTVGMTKPHVAVLNNAGTAHVGEFGGPEKIVEAKGEILEGLDADGVAVLNLDDKAFGIWQARAAGRKVLSFALTNPEADFYASNLARDARGCPGFDLHCPLGVARVQLNLLGTHNVANALAAAAAAHALGISLFGITSGLQAVLAVKGRAVAQLTAGGLRIIDDTYNANPTSMCAAVDILAAFSGRTGQGARQFCTGTARHVLLVERQSDVFGLAVVERVVVTGHALHFREFTDHFGRQVAFRQQACAGCPLDVATDTRSDVRRQLGNPYGLVVDTAQLGLEHHVFQARVEAFQRLLLVLIEEELGVGQAWAYDFFVALDDLTRILALDVGHGDEAWQQLAVGIQQAEVLLVVLHVVISASCGTSRKRSSNEHTSGTGHSTSAVTSSSRAGGTMALPSCWVANSAVRRAISSRRSWASAST